MIYTILIFIIGILLIKLNELNKEMKIYKNNYYTALKILEDYDPKLREFLRRKGQYENKKR